MSAMAVSQPVPRSLAGKASSSYSGSSLSARSRIAARPASARAIRSKGFGGARKLVVVAGESGGQNEDFGDVDKLLLKYFTFRALKETLAQIAETDLSPGKGDYKWLLAFSSENNPNDPISFINALFAERRDFAQRILAQRKMLYESWTENFQPENAMIMIEQANLTHLRDHLMCTVNLEEVGVGAAEDCIPANVYEDELAKKKEGEDVKAEESSK